NVGNLLETYRHFKDVDYLFHGFCVVVPGSWDYERNRLLPDQVDNLADELQTLLTESQNEGKIAAGIDSNLLAHIRQMKPNSYVEKAAEFPLHAGYGCSVPFSIAIVKPDGYVFPCFDAPWPDPADFNVEQQRLKE